jgi:Fe-S cluster biogenesis protein NfuA
MTTPDTPLDVESAAVDRLLDEIRTAASEPLWELVESLVRRLLALEAAGIERLLRLFADNGALDEGMLDKLCADELASGTLLVHGLHPLSTEERILRALARARPRLGAHGGDVQLVGVDTAGVARLRLVGGCSTCGSAQSTADDLIRRAIEAAAPEVTRIDLDAHRPAAAEPALVQLGSRKGKGAPTACSAPRQAPAAHAHSGMCCELCAAPLADTHAHVVELADRALRCACQACARALGQPGAGAGRYRMVPSRVLVDPEGALTDAQWTALGIPVRTAFLFFNSTLHRWVAFFPSPAGATESELPEPALATLLASHRLLQRVEPDVEALLVHGRATEPLRCFLVPIDACYELVARVRRHWRGFSGGDEAWGAIDHFFADLEARGRALGPAACADATRAGAA